MARLTIEACAAQRSPGRLMRRLDKIMSALVQTRFDADDISFTQWVALKVVRDGMVGNAGELSRELGITTGATTRMIDTLEARGLLVRDRGGADRRVVQLAVTDEGQEVVARLHERVAGTWNEVLVDIDQREIDQLTDTLARVAEAAERFAAREDAVREIAE